MEKRELKPCPFCGREAIIEEVKIANRCDYFIRCKCGVEHRLYKSKQNAIKMWNRRIKMHLFNEVDKAEKDETNDPWLLFDLLTSTAYGKQAYFLQDNGLIYSRVSHKTLKDFHEAINDWCDYCSF